MRVIVFSDSHGKLEFALRALQESGRVDLALHAGDYYRDGLKLAAETGLTVKAVCGNCDDHTGPAELTFEIEGRKILLAHGHIGVPRNRHDKLLEHAVDQGAQAVVFGHTHVAEAVVEGGVLLFNPGSISRPRDRGNPSYGILDISREGITHSIHRVII